MGKKMISAPIMCKQLGIFELVTNEMLKIQLYLANARETFGHTLAILKLLRGYPKINTAVLLNCRIS